MNDMPKFEKARKKLSKKICSNCHFAIQDVSAMFCLFRKLHTEDGLFKSCHCFLPKRTFDSITVSPEVLAEEFVDPYIRWGEDGHPETLWRSNFRELSGMLFDTKEEAIVATLARLKEVG